MADSTTVGLKAKLGIETDESSVRSEMNSLKSKFKEAAEMEMEADVETLKEDIMVAVEDAAADSKLIPDVAQPDVPDNAFEDPKRFRQSMDAIGRDPMPGQGGGGGAGATAGLMGEALGGMKGAGGKFLKVGLAGAVGFGILSKLTSLADTAPRMSKSMSMIQRGLMMFIRAPMDKLAKFIEDEATAFMRYGTDFFQDYVETGSITVALGRAAVNIATKGGNAGLFETFGRVTGALGGAGLGAWGGAKAGAAAGGALGSVIPGAGTAAGAVIGGAGGALLGGVAGLKMGGFYGDMKDRVVSFILDKWPGWPDLSWPGWTGVGSAIISPFPGWVGQGGIFNPFPGWIKNSPGVIDAFPGWDEWINPLEWNPPGFSAIMGEIESKIPELNWNVPSLSSVYGWIQNQIPTLNWNVPTLASVTTWVQDRISFLDWNIPSFSSVGNYIEDNIGFLDWNIPSLSDIEDLIDDHIPTFDWPGGGLGSPLTGFAEGGLVTSPTAAMVGEDGPEVIAPYDEYRRDMREAEMRGTSDGSASREVASELDDIKRELQRMEPSVTLEMDGRQVDRQNRKANRRYHNSRSVTK